MHGHSFASRLILDHRRKERRIPIFVAFGKLCEKGILRIESLRMFRHDAVADNHLPQTDTFPSPHMIGDRRTEKHGDCPA